MSSSTRVAMSGAEAVRMELKTKKAPSVETLKHLRTILGLDGVPDDPEPPVPAKGTLKSKAPVRGKKGIASASKVKPPPAIRIHEPDQSGFQPPDQAEQHKLATEVFNTTLKSLSQSAKSEKAASRSSVDTSKPAKKTTSQQPLQEQSPNKGAKAKGEGVKKPPASSGIAGTTDWALTAECASAALQYLQSRNDQVQDRGPDASLRSASLILLEKTISLGLVPQAEAQLECIHQRIRVNGRALATPPKASDGLAKFLVGRVDGTPDSSLYTFATTLQSQVLRLVLLIGAKCVTPELVRALEPDRVGSPAWMTLQGLAKGFQNAEQTGSQLQTISMALMKLYAICCKATSAKALAADAFDLFWIALRIRVLSWKRLAHTPDVKADVWMLALSAFNRYWKFAKDQSAAANLVARQLEDLREMLKDADYDASLPAEMTEALLRLSQQVPPQSRLLQLLQQDPRSTDAFTTLIMDCQTASSALGAFPQGLERCIAQCKSILSRLDVLSSCTAPEFDKTLPHAATLRKAATKVALEIEKMGSIDQHIEEVASLQTITIKIIQLSLATLSTRVPSYINTDHKLQKKEKLSALVTTLIRSMDAVLSVDKCAVNKLPDAVAEADSSVDRCGAMVNFLHEQCTAVLANEAIGDALNQIHVRISQAYWSRFAKAVEKHTDIQEQMKLLEKSVYGVEGLPFVSQKAAFLGLKYERMSAYHLQKQEYMTARRIQQKALDFNVKDGVMSDIVELALSGQYQKAWDSQNPTSRALARSLASYVKATFDHSSIMTTDDVFYDNRSLPPLHRAILLEKQVLGVIENKINNEQVKVCKLTARFAMDLLHQDQYCNYRLRFANSIMSAMLGSHPERALELLDSQQIEELVSHHENVDKVGRFLESYAPALRITLQLQHSFAGGRVEMSSLPNLLADLTSIIHRCKSQEALDSAIENVEGCVLLLQESADVARVLERPDMSLSALRAAEHLLSLGCTSRCSSMPKLLVQMLDLHVQTEDFSAASVTAGKLKQLVSTTPVEPRPKVEWYLAHSDYLLSVGRIDEVFKYLDRACKAADGFTKIDSSSTGKARLRQQTILCRAASTSSQLAFHSGKLQEALNWARQSVKISSAIWACIETFWDVAKTSSDSSDQVSMPELTARLAHVKISTEKPRTASIRAASYLGVSLLHCSTMRNMAALSIHCGNYQDAVSYLDQALRTAEKTVQLTLAADIHAELALLHARAGQGDKARLALQSLPDISSRDKISLSLATRLLNHGDANVLLGDITSAQQQFNTAKRLVQQIVELGSLDGRSQKPDPVKPSRAPTKAVSRKTPAKATRKRADAREEHAVVAESAQCENILFRAISARLNTLEIAIHMHEADGDLGQDGLHLATMPGEQQDPQVLMARAVCLLREALRLFSDDAVHNVLAETAMALPVRYKSSRLSGRVSFVQAATAPRAENETKGKAVKGSSRKKQTEQSITDGRTLLFEAHRALCVIKALPASRIPLEVVHSAHKVLTQISLLSSGLEESFVTSSIRLVLESLSPMDEARARERAIIASEKGSSERDDIQKWPNLSLIRPVPDAHHGVVGGEVLEDVADLPSSWSVISLGLNEARNELLVARIFRDRSPFILRIPLTRSDSLDMDDEEDLDFERAKCEMEDIILKANATVHDGRGSSSDKATRRVWFDERKSLDDRLACLLDNIENVWFGGFRGLLSASAADDAAFAKFTQAFSVALQKHLPSRQKSAKSSRPKIELHAHVLELFITLGHPAEADLDDALTDLLYFVVDILQFNGERNAYDEIDFDAMLVDVLDALNGYHEEKAAAREGSQSSHVILVMDKELQVFPWESLPCLRGQAVSRMPSLSAIRERLEMMMRQTQPQGQQGQKEGYVVPSGEGSYMLNPSSDLVATQDTFSSVFEQQLANFTAITNRAPTETEFEACLHDGPLFLYFGHGSGGHYIRGRTIRRLDKCAVSLLMGCSSLKLTECGAYEAHGMPWNYVHAGSPAVVGTLWDVTDRDIDRFAMKAMTVWGLITANEEVARGKPGGQRGQKAKANSAANSAATRGAVSLDQAVAHARDECTLKYLNGAAPVMYGIPVFLG